MPHSRRHFLMLLAAAPTLVPVLPGGTSFAAAIEAEPPRAASFVARLFTRPDSARIVGEAYLCTRMHRPDFEALLQELFPGTDGLPTDDGAAARMLSLRLDEQRRSDFESGRVVNVAGWVLSETEARLCALAALT